MKNGRPGLIMQVLGNHFRVVRFLLFSFVSALVFCLPMFGRTSDIRLSNLVGHMGTWALSRWALGTWALGTWALGTWALGTWALDTWVHGHNGTGHMGNGHLGSCLAKKGLCLSLADFLQWHIRCGKPVRTSTNTDCNWPTHNKKTPKTLQIFLTKDCDFGGSNEEEGGSWREYEGFLLPCHSVSGCQSSQPAPSRDQLTSPMKWLYHDQPPKSKYLRVWLVK